MDLVCSGTIPLHQHFWLEKCCRRGRLTLDDELSGVQVHSAREATPQKSSFAIFKRARPLYGRVKFLELFRLDAYTLTHQRRNNSRNFTLPYRGRALLKIAKLLFCGVASRAEWTCTPLNSSAPGSSRGRLSEGLNLREVQWDCTTAHKGWDCTTPLSVGSRPPMLFLAS